MVGLMDCNNFFVSCERLFRPDLARRPVLVLSSNDGCVVARSQEVKDLGISMGAPYFQIRELCEREKIAVFSSNFALYRDISARVMHALRALVGPIHVYSVDEAFFTLDSRSREEDILNFRAEILRVTGMPVSFGIGDTKTIAKIAGSFAKKENGVCIMDANSLRERADTITCGSIWGIGRETSRKLTEQGIRTLQDFLVHNIGYYREQFGVHGERLYLELTGREAEMSAESARQSYTSTRSFPKVLSERALLESAIGYHVSHVGEMLRKDGVCARAITVVCAPSRFDTHALREGSLSIILTQPTNDTQALLHAALALFHQVYKKGVPYKKAGFIAGSVIPTEYISESMFDAHDRAKESIYSVVDAINIKHGRNTVHAGVVHHTEKWQASAEKRSYAYTTDWSQIASVKAV